MPKQNDKLLGTESEGSTKKPSQTPSLLTVHLAIITVQVCFGGGSVVARLGLPSTNPVLFALIREAVAGPFLCFYAIYKDRTLPKLSDWRLFMGPGISLYLNQLFFIIGIKLSSSVTASAWQPSQPIMAIVLGVFLGTEKNLDRYKITGILFGTAGAIFMVLYHSSLNSGHSVWAEFGGSFCFFLNCLATALYLILGRRTLEHYSAATVTGFSYIWATAGMTITALIVGFDRTILDFICKDCNGHAWQVPVVTLYALAYWVVLQSFVCYGLITWVNQYADPSVNLAYTVLQPLTSTVASEIILAMGLIRQCHGEDDETATCLYGASLKDLGAIGIVCGLYCVIYSDRKFANRMSDEKKNISFSGSFNSFNSSTQTGSNSSDDRRQSTMEGLYRSVNDSTDISVATNMSKDTSETFRGKG